MKYAIGFILGALLIGVYCSLTTRINNKELELFYATSCVALPGQVAIMKWVGHEPQCKRVEVMKEKDPDITNWKKFM